MFRWTNLVFTSVLIAGVVAFFFLFFDPILKYALVKGGQKAFKAKVEVGRVATEIFKGKITITELAVANKKEPMTNLFEFERAEFQLLPAPLLEKKVVVESSSIEGLRWGRARKTSGELKTIFKQDKPSAAEQKIAEVTEKSKEFSLGRAEAVKGAGQAKVAPVKPENLSSLKVLGDGEKKLQSVDGQWKEKAASLQNDPRIEEVKKDIEGLKAGGGSSPQEIAAKIKKAKEIEKKIKGLQGEVKETKQSAQNDFGAVGSLLKEAKEAKKKDLAAFGQLAGLPSFDAESIAFFILGPKVKEQTQKALHWHELAKEHLPAKAEEPPKKLTSSGRGVFISFPKDVSYPALTWKKGLLSGAAGTEPNLLNFSGEIKDVTSQPSLWPRPMAAEIKGAQKGQTLNLQAALDHRKEPGRDVLELVYKGYPLKDVQLGQSEELGVRLEEGTAAFDLSVVRTADVWKGTADIEMSPVKLQAKSQVSGMMAGKIAQAVAAIKRFHVQVVFSSGEDDFDFHFKSDIGRTLADALKGMFKAELDKQKKEIEDKVNKLYQEKAAALEKSLAAKQSSVLSSLAGKEGTLDNLLKEALAKSKVSPAEGQPPASLKDLKNIFKK